MVRLILSGLYFLFFDIIRSLYLFSLRCSFRVSIYVNRGRVVVGRSYVMQCPVYFYGLGKFSVGDDVVFGSAGSNRIGNGAIRIRVRPGACVTIGSGSLLGNNTCIIAHDCIDIGENCLLGDSLVIYDSDFHSTSISDRHVSAGEFSPVKVGDNVWVGSRVMILKGVKIGENSVISAGSVVTNDVERNSIYGGVPARKIRNISE